MALAHMAALVQIAESLLADQKLDFNIGNAVRQSLMFYPYAMERDTQLVQNSLAALDKMGSNASGILVVGGFHVEAIDQYLRDHNISYLQLNPSITRDITSTEQLNYVKRMCDEHVSSAELSSDLKVLRGQKSRRKEGSAIAPVSDIEVEGQEPGAAKGTMDKMMNGLSEEMAKSIATDEGLAKQLGDQPNALVGLVFKD